MDHLDSTRSLGFAHETVSASPFAWGDGQHGWQQSWNQHGTAGTPAQQQAPWTPGDDRETDEEAESDCAAAIWRELSGDVQEQDCVVSAAASIAAALASGEPLPANTAACLRQRVPSLLGLELEVMGGVEAAGTFSQTLTQQLRTDGAATQCGEMAASGSSGTIRLQLPLACGAGCEQGLCVFTLAEPASPEERRELASFTTHLGRRLERTKQHLAKQELEGSLYELSQAFARGDSLDGRPSAASLPPLPSWCGSPCASWVGSTSSKPQGRELQVFNRPPERRLNADIALGCVFRVAKKKTCHNSNQYQDPPYKTNPVATPQPCTPLLFDPATWFECLHAPAQFSLSSPCLFQPVLIVPRDLSAHTTPQLVEQTCLPRSSLKQHVLLLPPVCGRTLPVSPHTPPPS